MDYHAAKLGKKFLSQQSFLTFIPNPPARLRLGVAQLVEGIVDGLNLHGTGAVKNRRKHHGAVFSEGIGRRGLLTFAKR